MIRCEYCNASVDETAGVCPHCGAPLPIQTQQTQEQEQTAEDTDAEEAAGETTENGTAQSAGTGTTTTASVGAGILGGLASLLALRKKKGVMAPPHPVKPPAPKKTPLPEPKPGRPAPMQGRNMGPGAAPGDHRTAPGGPGQPPHGQRMQRDGNRGGGPGGRR